VERVRGDTHGAMKSIGTLQETSRQGEDPFGLRWWASEPQPLPRRAYVISLKSSRSASELARACAWAIALASLALVSAACSGGTTGPNVAQVSSTPGASPTGRSGGLAFAACMRSHGISGFPDSGRIEPGSGIDLNSTQFQVAQRACGSLLLQGSGNSLPPAADQRSALEFAACMRSHGVPSFPDPTFLGGRKLVITLPAGVSGDSPLFQTALRACQSLVVLPGGGPHPKRSP
jgi:hypothetical protein